MNHEPCRYFVPGPVWVRPELLAEMTHPMIGHRSGEFREVVARILENLKRLFGTSQHTFIATSSGTGLMEGAILNTVPRCVLTTTCGAFSERWTQIAEHIGVECDRIEHDWGESVDPTRLGNYFAGRRHHYDAVTLTQNETSTGVTNDIATLSAVIHDQSPDTLVLVDAVSSLGAMPLRFDEWGLDVCFASTQKGLGLPPGLTVFAVSERAMQCARSQQYRGTYFDFLEFERHAKDGGTPFTPSIPHIFALDRQLRSILDEEGLEHRFERHRAMQLLTREQTAAVAEPMVTGPSASASVTTLRPLAGTPADLLNGMKSRGYTLGGGYGQWKGTTFRIGHMGDLAIEDLASMLEVLNEVGASR